MFFAPLPLLKLRQAAEVVRQAAEVACRAEDAAGTKKIYADAPYLWHTRQCAFPCMLLKGWC